MNGILFLVIGPSGAGKNSLISKVVSNNKLVRFLPSYTSRPKREDEKEGNPYYFVSIKEFERKIQNKELIEWKFVHGHNYYGIGKKEVDDALIKGKNLITDIEVLGAIDTIDHFPKNCVSIFVDVESRKELVRRIKKRGSLSDKDLAQRVQRIDFEMLYRDHFSYIVSNHDLNKCTQDLVQIIDYETSLNKYNFLKPPSAILHYVIRIIVMNSASELLLLQKKRPSSSSEWQFLTGHVLSNESPKDALYRELHFICPSISEEYKELIYSLTPISENKHFLENHYHYEMVFKVKLDLPYSQSENYDLLWLPRHKAKELLDKEDILLIDLGDNS